MTDPKTTRPNRLRALAYTAFWMLALASVAAPPTAARADDWHRDRGYDHRNDRRPDPRDVHRDWRRGYRPPPVVYGGYPAYPPPPVVYGPAIGIALPGISIGIR